MKMSDNEYSPTDRNSVTTPKPQAQGTSQKNGKNIRAGSCRGAL